MAAIKFLASTANKEGFPHGSTRAMHKDRSHFTCARAREHSVLAVIIIVHTAAQQQQARAKYAQCL